MSSLANSFLKSAFLVVLFASVFSVGGTKAEAASASWHYGYSYTICDSSYYYDTAYVDAQVAQAPSNGVTVWKWGSGPWFSRIPVLPDVTLFTTVNGLPTPGHQLFQTLPPGADIDFGGVFALDLSTGNFVSSIAPAWVECTVPPVFQNLADFTATTNKDTYSPGENVNISLTAWTSITNSCNFFSSCGAVVGAAAVFGGSQVAQCDAGGGCSISRAFVAPTTPGTYTISLTGCYSSASNCSASSISFVVTAPLAAPCTYTGPFSWGACSASGTWNAASGGSATANNSAPGYTGSATYSCSNTIWSGPTSQSCDPLPCSYTGPFSWGAGCSASGTWNAASGGSATANNSASGYTGSATYACSKGEWSGPTSQSCDAVLPSSCSYTGYLSWGAGCSANGAWNAVSGGSVTANNSAPGYTGSATYACSNGTWSGPTSQSCDAAAPCTNGANNPPACNTCTAPQIWNGTSCVAAPASCPATTINNCTLPSTPSGTNSPGSCGGGGNCNYSCTNGTWSSNQSCPASASFSVTVSPDTYSVAPSSKISAAFTSTGSSFPSCRLLDYNKNPLSFLYTQCAQTGDTSSFGGSTAPAALGTYGYYVEMMNQGGALAVSNKFNVTVGNSCTYAANYTVRCDWLTAAEFTKYGIPNGYTAGTANFSVNTCGVSTYFGGCSAPAAAACASPWGGAFINSGSGVTAWQSATVPFGSSCQSETRSCSNGTLSGTFTNQTCSVNPPPVNNAPTANITIPIGNPTVIQGTPVSFVGTGSDPDAGDPITAYQWREGNCSGAPVLSSNPSFTFNTPTTGVHTIYFRVRDGNNTWSACDSRIVLVTPTPINGVCGTATAVTPTKPVASLCAAGTPTAVTPAVGIGPWYWDCAGLNGGTTVSCMAPYVNVPGATCPNGTCQKALGETILTCPMDCKATYQTF